MLAINDIESVLFASLFLLLSAPLYGRWRPGIVCRLVKECDTYETSGTRRFARSHILKRQFRWSLALLLLPAFGPAAEAQNYPANILGAKVTTAWNDERTECDITVEVQNLKKASLTPVLDPSSQTEYQSFPRISSTAVMTEVGAPELPYVLVNLEIPDDSYTTLIVNSIETPAQQTWHGVKIVPATEPWAEVRGAPAPKITERQAIYQSNSFFPDKGSAELQARSTLRGSLTQTIAFYPIRYSPGLSIVTIQKIHAKMYVNFGLATAKASWKTLRAAKAAGYSSALENQYLTWMPDFKAPVPPTRRGTQAGADYLIVVEDGLSEGIKRLAEQKVRSGLTVKTTQLSQLGISAASTDEDRRTKIRSWIEIQYAQTPKPTYLLLVGDWKAIPPYKKTKHPYDQYENEFVATDLYYVNLDSGMLPSLAVGRLPARGADELKIMLDKISDYEKSIDQNASTARWGRAIVIGDYQNTVVSGKTTTSRWFHQTAYDVGFFIKDNPNESSIKDINQYYVADPAGSPKPWYNYDNTQIPSKVIALFVADATAVKGISTSWPRDVRLLLHRDHGSKDGWGTPAFSSADVKALAKPKIPPVVLSINCETGWYDSESSFALELMRSPNGAAGVIAASRVSYSKYNDRFTEGLIKAIWETFEFDFQLPERKAALRAAKRLGPVLSAGKTHLYKSYQDDTAKLTLELFNLFGDPDMRLTSTRMAGTLPEGVRAIRFPSSFGEDSIR